MTNTADEQSLLTVARAKSLLDNEESCSIASSNSMEDIPNNASGLRRVNSHHTEESSIFDGLDNISEANISRYEFQFQSSSPSSSVEVSVPSRMTGVEKLSTWKAPSVEPVGTTQCTEKNPHDFDEKSIENDAPSPEVYSTGRITSTKREDHTSNGKSRLLQQTLDIDGESLARGRTSISGCTSNNWVDMDQEQDTFVRSGTRLKSLLDSALREVAIGVSNGGEVELSLRDDQEEIEDDGGEEQEEKTCSGQKRKRLHSIQEEEQKRASELAREKMAEVITLKRELKEAMEHAKAMEHANSVLRDASTTSSARLETLSEALRIAGEQAANARADADASEARASSLASQLKTFKTALDETKRTVDTIRAEHDDISFAARDLEAKLLRAESELNRAQKEKSTMEVEHQKICNQLQDLQETEKVLREGIVKRDDELAKLKKSLAERDSIDKARLERMARLENELSNSRSLIVELTSSASEAESTTAELRVTICTLQKENQSLHSKIRETLDSASKERERLQEALVETETEAQKLRLKATADDEELQKARLDKTSSEKEVLQLKNRIANLEKRLSDTNALGSISPGTNTISDLSSLHSEFNSLTPASSTNSSLRTPGGNSQSQNTFSASQSTKTELIGIPKLKSAPNVSKDSGSQLGRVASNDRGQARGSQTNCSICYRAPYGIMKACQCGNSSCNLRAHSVCIAGKKPLPSVSHPGTPAPSLPIVLCRK